MRRLDWIGSDQRKHIELDKEDQTKQSRADDINNIGEDN